MLPPEQMIARLVLAAALGSAVGLERERRDWVAGLRTHMIVSVASALIMMASTYGFDDVLGREATVLDPSRIAAQVVTGIGFLGAGVIIFRKDAVLGLTTAAGIWAVAGIGLAVGGGLYLTATVATGVILVILAGLKPIENRIWRRRRRRSMTLLISRGTSLLNVEAAVKSVDKVLTELYMEQSDEPDCYAVHITLNSLSRKESLVLADHLNKVEGMRRIELNR